MPKFSINHVKEKKLDSRVKIYSNWWNERDNKTAVTGKAEK